MTTIKNRTSASGAVESKLQVFLAQDARLMLELGIMSVEFPPEVRPLVGQAVENGLKYGDEVKVLFNIPGFSLIHAWLKKDYPLSVHSHNSDCLYWIVSGTLKLGNQVLGKGDGFFVPANVPYSYVPVGNNGVEVLEFRHAVSFDFKSRSKEAFWVKAAETCRNIGGQWQKARSPLAIDPSEPAGAGEMSTRAHEEWTGVADQFWVALDSGRVDEAIACCTPSATTWHSFDQKSLNLAESAAGYRAFVAAFAERSTTQIRRSFLPDGIIQQHVLVVRPKPEDRGAHGKSAC